MTSFKTRLGRLVLLISLCFSGSARPQELQESICTRVPDLQVLTQGVGSFDCRVDSETKGFNCSGLGIPALPLSDDPDVPQNTEVFDFSNNRIKCLPQINNTNPSCGLAHCDAGGCLLDLRLGNNNIDFLHWCVFHNLTCLTFLDLSRNLITNRTVQEHHFQRLSSLQHLDLHGNPLRTLPDNVLVSTYLSHLRTLNLSFCQLEAIGEVALDHFSDLTVLDLSHNKLRLLSSITFNGLGALTILDLRWNRLEVIQRDTFGDLPCLEELRLDHNRLYHIYDIAFNSRAPLESLGLFSNKFSEIPLRPLSALKKLRALDMSDNPFVSLEKTEATVTVMELTLDHLDSLITVKINAFTAFPQLSRLSLRFARSLTTVSGKAFSRATGSLREVLLDHNGLQSLPGNLLPWGQLSLLTLHDNPWDCDCRLDWAAGLALGNTSIRCDAPEKLYGQALQTLRPDELGCMKALAGMQAVIGLALGTTFLVGLAMAMWHWRRRMPCACIRGTKGRYVTVFTKDPQGDPDNHTCADGEVDDLDLGVGEGSRSEGGTVMILLNTVRNGYRRLRAPGGESSQDLTHATDV